MTSPDRWLRTPSAHAVALESMSIVSLAALRGRSDEAADASILDLTKELPADSPRSGNRLPVFFLVAGQTHLARHQPRSDSAPHVVRRGGRAEPWAWRCMRPAVTHAAFACLRITFDGDIRLRAGAEEDRRWNEPDGAGGRVHVRRSRPRSACLPLATLRCVNEVCSCTLSTPSRKTVLAAPASGARASPFSRGARHFVMSPERGA